MDPLSPIAPARLRALALPAGRVRRTRFRQCLDRVRAACVVRLGDVAPDRRQDRGMFSPLSCPEGRVLYDLVTASPAASHLALSPYELFREPLVFLGIADAGEYRTPSYSADATSTSTDRPAPGSNKTDTDTDSTISLDTANLTADLTAALDDLREKFPRGVAHRILFFDASPADLPRDLERDVLCVPSIPTTDTSDTPTATMAQVMADLTSQVLAELTALARSLQALPTVEVGTTQNGHGHDPASGAATGLALTRARSASPAVDHAAHRMSMPILPSSGLSHSLSAGNSRTGSPDVGARQATTFEEMGIPPGGAAAPNRASIHGFGPGSITEKAREKGKVRVGLVVGTVYLQAGCWGEALAALVANTAKARALGDQLWHARGLESVMVCLLLLAWSGAEFAVPTICYPVAEKPAAKGAAAAASAHADPTAELRVAHTADPDRRRAAREQLAAVLPDLANMILSVYARSATFSGDSQPALAASECMVRVAKLFAVLHIVGNKLDADALAFIVLGTALPARVNLGVSRLTVHPTRTEISKLLFRAVPDEAQPGRVSSMDYVMILAGIASVFSLIGMHRKRAIILKELLGALIPGLIQARKVGAAEMGLHPAAGLAALTMASGGVPGSGVLEIPGSEDETGLDQFLSWMGAVYGIPSKARAVARPSDAELTNGDGEHVQDFASAQLAAIERILLESRLRSFGSLSMKLEVLRTCINFCEALPDFQGVMDFTSVLLSIVGPGRAAKLGDGVLPASLARDEQLRMANNITRILSSARSLGMPDLATSYWDFFLVQGLAVAPSYEHLSLLPLSSAELSGAANESNEPTGPFLHNPFQKLRETRVPETLLVVGEEREFIATLHNPFDFDLDVESVSIATEGAPFRSSRQGAVLGPFRSQRFAIVAVPEAPGQATVVGCTIKVRGCRAQTFPIVVEPWRPAADGRVRRIGVHAALEDRVRPVSNASTASKDGAVAKGAPTFSTVPLTIIPEQPVVTVTAVSLQQSALMVLEGERATFAVTLANVSAVPVNFIQVSFVDSTQTAFQDALANRSLPMAEVHELEHQLLRNPAVRLGTGNGAPPTAIAPRASATFQVEVLGKPGLTEVTVRFAYAHVTDDDGATEKVYTRLVAVPVAVTVNASVHVQRADVLPFSGDFAWANQRGTTSEVSPSADGNRSRFQTLLERVGREFTADEYCLLLLDLRNTWPTPLTVSLQVRVDPDAPATDRKNPHAYAVEETIQPGHLNRLLVVLPKLHLAHRFDRIQALNPKNERQFIVSQHAVTPAAERALREAFWYREALLQMLTGEWREGATGRRGEVDLRAIRFSRSMVDHLTLGDVSIDLRILGAAEDGDGSGDGAAATRTGRHTFAVRVDEQVALRATVRNRSTAPVRGVLRLQPRMARQPGAMALEVGKRFAWSGVLQRVMEGVGPGEAREVTVGVAALCRGEFEVGACVEEVEERAATRSGEVDAVVEEGKRIWFAHTPCRIFAR